MKPCKDGYEACKELARINLNKLTCDKQCYKCIYWGENYCQINIVKTVVKKSQDYINLHKE